MKQGKVKAIPVKEVTEGMQVIDKFGNIGKIIRIDPRFVIVEVDCRDGETRNHDDTIQDLKTLVVEYDASLYESEFRGTYKQLPLKYSQWQSAIDNGEVDSDKIVEFEIKYLNPNNIIFDHDYEGFESFAKIIPQKKRMYTEDELREAMHFASSHLSSVRGINQYIEALNQKS